MRCTHRRRPAPAIVLISALLMSYGGCDLTGADWKIYFGPILQGTVADSKTGQPLVGATAEIIFHPGAVHVGTTRQTNSAGGFDFGEMLAGWGRDSGEKNPINVVVEARAEGFSPLRLSVAIYPARDCRGGENASGYCRYTLQFSLEPQAGP